ncbi:MAG: T9SS type A sorting domain-containing protein [Paludibacteraceae bacterium]|nr:T9SS type A sorting domain-containing protein [Paludibacteraceae bacterium]
MQPGGKIDNIEITDSRACDAPTGLKVSYQGSTTILDWKGTASEYEVWAYSYQTKEWFGPKTVIGTTTTFANLPMGQADFIVRSKCADDLYSLKATLSDLVYFPDMECIPFLLLDDNNCYITSSVSGPDWQKKVKWTKQYVNEGPESELSRHTRHFSKDEYDPRTVSEDGHTLRTVPDGDDVIGTVRLGNWRKGSEGERIEYKYHVDAKSAAVLMLKYACVLEHPNDGCVPNPGFLLRVLDKNKHLISDCASADFDYKAAAASTDPSWHKSTPEFNPINIRNVMWKDWTPVGVNLADYDGQDLTIQLTSYDCGGGGHYGYSYFTLNCSDGKFKGMKCGQINPKFEAPDGFVYRWAYASSEQHRLPDGTMPEQYVLGHGQTFEAGMEDDSLYVVDCMFVQDSACFFSLYASTLATNPISIMKKPKVLKNCSDGKYTIELDGSKSWVQEIDHVKKDTLKSKLYKIDRYDWEVTGPKLNKPLWSDEVTPSFTLPSSGGDFTITFTTSSGTCDSTITYVLHLDSLSATRDTLIVPLCDEARKISGYKWKEKLDTAYFTYCLDSVVYPNPITSCDSIKYLKLVEPYRVPVNKVVLPENLPFTYRGRKYYESTIDTIPNMSCDTTWILNMTVYDNLKVEMPDTFVICGKDNALTLQYKITQGFSTGYTYSFADSSLPTDTVEIKQLIGEHEIVIPLNPTPRPNQYEGSLKLFDSIPWWNVTLPFKLIVRYDSAIVEQKWNDVLYVLAPGYNNGDNEGYEFTAFQWYRNDTLLEGETRSYLYQPLDFNSEYYVELTRADDGVVMASCPITPTNRPQSANYPSIINMQSSASPGQRILVRLSQPAKIWFYSVSGQIYAAYTLSEGDSMITAPLQRGMYIVKMMDEQGEVKAQRLLVQ